MNASSLTMRPALCRLYADSLILARCCTIVSGTIVSIRRLALWARADHVVVRPGVLERRLVEERPGLARVHRAVEVRQPGLLRVVAAAVDHVRAGGRAAGDLAVERLPTLAGGIRAVVLRRHAVVLVFGVQVVHRLLLDGEVLRPRPTGTLSVR